MGLEPIAFVREWAVAGVEPDIMGIGPAKAVPKLLAKTGLTLADIDLVEINEAFASQSVYCVRELGLDPDKTNVNGGAIATGHPLGATGAVLTVQAPRRAEAPRRETRHRHHVHRRRHGVRLPARNGVTPEDPTGRPRTGSAGRACPRPRFGLPCCLQCPGVVRDRRAMEDRPCPP